MCRMCWPRAMGGGGAPPAGLDWNLYLGPIAENVPYHPIYHPFNWRGWLDFGSGALGDMGAHLIDHPFWALELTYPSSIEATSHPGNGAARSAGERRCRIRSRPACTINSPHAARSRP